MKIVAFALAGASIWCITATAFAQRPGEWTEYACDKAASRYTPLSQIDRTNFGKLKIAWRWSSPDNPYHKSNPDSGNGPNEATPLMVSGVLYTSTGQCR